MKISAVFELFVKVPNEDREHRFTSHRVELNLPNVMLSEGDEIEVIDGVDGYIHFDKIKLGHHVQDASIHLNESFCEDGRLLEGLELYIDSLKNVHGIEFKSGDVEKLRFLQMIASEHLRGYSARKVDLVGIVDPLSF